MADTLLTGTTLIESSTRSVGDVPIGGIVPWLPNLSGVPGLPEGWMLCDGSTVNDALSPMNGTTIPDLNGDNRFLRGEDTAGGTGGNTTTSLASMGTIYNISENLNSIGTSATELRMLSGGSGSTTRYGTQTNSILPPYYNVVWIIRIR